VEPGKSSSTHAWQVNLSQTLSTISSQLSGILSVAADVANN
jgi:hypothetical protein